MFVYAIVTGAILALTLLVLLYSGFKQGELGISLIISLPIILSSVYVSLKLGGISVLPLCIISIVFMSLLGILALIMLIAASIDDDGDVAAAGGCLLLVVANTITFLGL